MKEEERDKYLMFAIVFSTEMIVRSEKFDITDKFFTITCSFSSKYIYLSSSLNFQTNKKQSPKFLFTEP